MQKVNLHLLLILVMLLFSVSAAGQKRDSFLRDLDAFLDMREAKAQARTDSNYIGYYPYKWSGQAFAKSTGMHIVSNEIGDIALSTGMQNRIGLGISYRSLGLSYSHVIGKRHGLDLTLDSYGKHFCFEFAFRASETLSDKSIPSDMDALNGQVNNVLLVSDRLNLMYCFNPRFSYGAAMKQSQIQRRSTGSFIAAVSWGMWDLLFLDETGSYVNFFEANYFYQRVSIGAGYGYNLVFGNRHWLMHASLVPMWTVYDMEVWRQRTERNLINYPFGHVAFSGTARAGIYFRWGTRWSLGYSGIVNQMMASNKFRRKAEDYQRFGAQEWQMNLTLTCRF